MREKPNPDEVKAAGKAASVDARESGRGGRPVRYEGCSPDLGKGEIVDIAPKLADHAVVTDTGAFAQFLGAYKDQDTFTQEEIDAIYKDTIAHGVNDHHPIDAFFASKGLRPEKCSTRMAVEYKDAILALIQKHRIQKVITHYDSDLDAVASSYLVKSLIDNGELPRIAEDLATVTNKADYGRFDVADPDVFVNTLPGLVAALKDEFGQQCRREIQEKGFSPALLAKYENVRNSAIFDLLNALNDEKMHDVEFDIGGDVSRVEERLSEELRRAIIEGKKRLKESYETFLKDFTEAEKFRAAVAGKDGNDMMADIIVGESTDPLLFINLAYTRTSPETIVAAYAGQDRKAGDAYDIGIQPDQANVFDLRNVCLALNKAERKKRDALYGKPADKRSAEEQRLIDGWETQKAEGKLRDMFPGIQDMVARGDVDEEDILNIDPTPLVAGGSLIPASRSSILTEDEFRAVLREFAVS